MLPTTRLSTDGHARAVWRSASAFSQRREARTPPVVAAVALTVELGALTMAWRRGRARRSKVPLSSTTASVPHEKNEGGRQELLPLLGEAGGEALGLLVALEGFEDAGGQGAEERVVTRRVGPPDPKLGELLVGHGVDEAPVGDDALDVGRSGPGGPAEGLGSGRDVGPLLEQGPEEGHDIVRDGDAEDVGMADDGVENRLRVRHPS